MWNSKPSSMSFSNSTTLSPLANIMISMDPLLVDVFVTSYMGHFKYTGSLRYVDISTIDIFDYIY